jgi:hypothetical protein
MEQFGKDRTHWVSNWKTADDIFSTFTFSPLDSLDPTLKVWRAARI